MIGCPSVRDMCSQTRRVTTSVGPPAAKGTMTVIGLSGYCATAGKLNTASIISPTIRRGIERISVFSLDERGSRLAAAQRDIEKES
jgi:hypothetical protein